MAKKKADIVEAGEEIVKTEKKKMKPRGGNSPASTISAFFLAIKSLLYSRVPK